MKFIDNVDKFYKMWSVQLMTLVFFLEIASKNWEQYSQFVPEPWNSYIQGLLLIVAVIARLIRQDNLRHDTK